MSETIDNSSLCAALELLSKFSPFSKSQDIAPRLLLSRPSSRYAHTVICKRALESLEESRLLMKKITDSVVRIQADCSRQEAALRNSLAPVSALPVECLEEIFRWLATGATYSDVGYTTSRVCSLWRLISLRLPILWTHVRCEAHLQRMVKANKKMLLPLPLRVTMSSRATYPPKIWEDEESRENIVSLRYVATKKPTRPALWLLPTTELPSHAELIVDARSLLSWPLATNAAEYPVITLESVTDYDVGTLQILGARIVMATAYFETPKTMMFSHMPLELMQENLGAILDPDNEEGIEQLYLSNIVSGVDWTRHFSSIGRKLVPRDEDNEGDNTQVLRAVILDKCFPHLVGAILTSWVTELDEIQIVLPDLRHESIDNITHLGRALNCLVRCLLLQKYSSITMILTQCP